MARRHLLLAACLFACGKSSSETHATVQNGLGQVVLAKAAFQGASFEPLNPGALSTARTISPGSGYAYALLTFPSDPQVLLAARTREPIDAPGGASTTVTFAASNTVGPCNGLAQAEYDDIVQRIFPNDGVTRYDRADCPPPPAVKPPEGDAGIVLTFADGGDAGDSGASWITGFQGALLSGDDGTHFGARIPPAIATFRSLFCVEGTHVWIAGDNGTMLFTPDLGKSWEVQLSGGGASLRGVAFANRYQGTAVGDRGTVLRTTDGGGHWQGVALGSSPGLYALYGVAQIGALVIAVGEAGTVARSTDGAQSFSLSAPDASPRYAVRLADDVHHAVSVGGAGSVLLSENAGADWRAVRISARDLRGVALSADGQRIVAVGDAGTILRSTDGGSTWSTIVSGTSADLYAISFSDVAPDVAWIAGAAGTILRTNDGGATFTSLASPTSADLLAVEQM
jgi:photosystem II stability/assembly factor-like uncharacterized protein